MFTSDLFTFCLANAGHGVEDVPTTVPRDGNRNDTAPINIIWNGIEKGSSVEVSFLIWFAHIVVSAASSLNSGFWSYFLLFLFLLVYTL